MLYFHLKLPPLFLYNIFLKHEQSKNIYQILWIKVCQVKMVVNVNKSTLHMCIFLAFKVSLINVQRHNEMRLFSKENSLETLPSVYEV